MRIGPDHRPEARARAQENHARYPDARDGGPLPQVAPEAVELIKTRILFDFAHERSPKQAAWLGVGGFTAAAVVLWLRLGADRDALVAGGVVWVVTMALLPVLLALGRRSEAKAAAALEAAGFRVVTDQNGRPRYLPPGGTLPGPW